MLEVKVIETDEDLEKAFKIREAVFVYEQNVERDEEYDEYESLSTHVLATYDGKAVGTARWRRCDDKVKLERFAVIRQARGRGVGAALVRALENDIKACKLEGQLIMHAQTHAVPFYEKFGYTKKGTEFMECNISHYVMVKEPEK